MNTDVARNGAAERKADHVRAVYAEVIEHSRDVVGFEHMVGACRSRAPEAAEIVADHAPAGLEQWLYLRFPHPTVEREPVNEQHGVAYALGDGEEAVNGRGDLRAAAAPV